MFSNNHKPPLTHTDLAGIENEPPHKRNHTRNETLAIILSTIHIKQTNKRTDEPYVQLHSIVRVYRDTEREPMN